MDLVCLDLEGVLLPEIWIAVAEATGVEGLRRTTRDEPDYDTLMHYRLDLLAQHGLGIADVEAVLGELEPLPGAVTFTEWLVSQTRLIILSDTFSQFARPLMGKLGSPTLFCHDLEIADDGRITGYQLRQPDQKRRAVEAFRALNFNVIAAGDSYNDLSMIRAAHHGILFRPPESLVAENPDLPITQTHDELRAALEAAITD